MQVGKLQIMDSGAVKLRLGEVVLDVVPGAADRCCCPACAALLLDPGPAHAVLCCAVLIRGAVTCAWGGKQLQRQVHAQYSCPMTCLCQVARACSMQHVAARVTWVEKAHEAPGLVVRPLGYLPQGSRPKHCTHRASRMRSKTCKWPLLWPLLCMNCPARQVSAGAGGHQHPGQAVRGAGLCGPACCVLSRHPWPPQVHTPASMIQAFPGVTDLEVDCRCYRGSPSAFSLSPQPSVPSGRPQACMELPSLMCSRHCGLNSEANHNCKPSILACFI